MSRIGKKPVVLPAGVTATINGSHVEVKGPKGTLVRDFPEIITITQEGNELICTRPNDEIVAYIIIDGYNVIFAIDELKRVADTDIALARDILIRTMCNYTAFRKCHAEIVFDAYKRKGAGGSVEKCGNVTVVYTKEGMTADSYVEKATYDLAKTHTVRVVTTDLAEQNVVLGSGGLRVSAREFKIEIESTTAEINEIIDKYKK